MRVHTELALAQRRAQIAGVVVLVAKRGRLLVNESAGYMSLVSQEAMDSNAIFSLREISSAISAFGALLLVDDGRVLLDDPVSRYLPEFKNLTVQGRPPSRRTPLTVEHLMMQTSGFATQAPPRAQNITRKFDISLAEYVSLIAQQPLISTPGKAWALNGQNTAVLGRIIEVVSGQSFESFMQERVFLPLEMMDSSFFIPEGKQQRIPDSYQRKNGKFLSDGINKLRPGQRYSAPEMGMLSTARDLKNFCEMMLERGKWKGRELIAPGVIVDMISQATETTTSQYTFGRGWAVHSAGCTEMNFAATDGSYGLRASNGSVVWMDPSSQLVRIYLTQCTAEEFPISDLVMNASFGE